MQQVNRRSALSMGAAAVAGFVAIPLTSRTAGAEEHRYQKIHEAAVALEFAKDEIEHAPHDFGGQKKEALEAINKALVHLKKLRDFK